MHDCKNKLLTSRNNDTKANIKNIKEVSDDYMEKAKINDRVIITSNCNSKGKTGKVLYSFMGGYSKKCRHLMILMDDGSKQAYNDKSVKVISNSSESVSDEMTGMEIANILYNYMVMHSSLDLEFVAAGKKVIEKLSEGRIKCKRL